MKQMVSDEDLLKRVAVSRDHAAFQLLFDRFSKPAFNLARHMTQSPLKAEDVVQDAMLRVWLKANQFDSGRGTAKAWILRVVANQALASKRNTRNEKSKEMMEMEGIACAEKHLPTEGFEHREITQILAKTLDNLPDSMRKILALYFGCQMTQSEIAETLSMSQRTVGSRIQQGLEQLRERLELAGFPAAIPLLEQEPLSHAFLTGHEPPPEIFNQILKRLGSVR